MGIRGTNPEIPRPTPTPILVELTRLFAGEAAADDVEGELGKTELAVGYAPVEGVSVTVAGSAVL